MTRRALVLLAGLALLGGCSTADSGNDSPPASNSDRPSATPAARFAVPDGAWLIALEVVQNRRDPLDDEQRVFLSYQPETGAATYRILPPDTKESGGTTDDQSTGTPGQDAELQVSADYQRSVRAVGTTGSERQSGTVTVFTLATGAAQKLDLRQITGDIRLEPRRVVFDPKDPDMLRVLAADKKIWTVNVATQKATEAGTTTINPDDAWFDPATGDVTQGLDGKDRPIPGGVVLDSDKDYPDLPGSLPDYIKTDDGTVWAFAEEGTGSLAAQQLRVYKLPPGAADWTLLPGKPTPTLVSGLPGVERIKSVDWARPPLR